MSRRKSVAMKTQLMLVLFVISMAVSSTVSAQSRLNSAEVEKNLIKPERVEETCPLPLFPEGADSAVKGMVLVLNVIDTSGYVETATVKIERPQGMGFGDAVERVVSEWRYKPCYWNGNPSKYTVKETFYFENGQVRIKEADESMIPKKEIKIEVSEE